MNTTRKLMLVSASTALSFLLIMGLNTAFSANPTLPPPSTGLTPTFNGISLINSTSGDEVFNVTTVENGIAPNVQIGRSTGLDNIKVFGPIEFLASTIDNITGLTNLGTTTLGQTTIGTSSSNKNLTVNGDTTVSGNSTVAGTTTLGTTNIGSASLSKELKSYGTIRAISDLVVSGRTFISDLYVSGTIKRSDSNPINFSNSINANTAGLKVTGFANLESLNGVFSTEIKSPKISPVTDTINDTFDFRGFEKVYITKGALEGGDPVTFHVNGPSTFIGDTTIGSSSANKNLTVNGNSTINGSLKATSIGVYSVPDKISFTVPALGTLKSTASCGEGNVMISCGVHGPETGTYTHVLEVNGVYIDKDNVCNALVTNKINAAAYMYIVVKCLNPDGV